MMPLDPRTQAGDPRSVADLVFTTYDEGYSKRTGHPKGSPMADQPAKPNHLELTAEIVSAYVANNSLPQSELPTLLDGSHRVEPHYC
jgi:hypothetical protein